MTIFISSLKSMGTTLHGLGGLVPHLTSTNIYIEVLDLSAAPPPLLLT